MPLAVFLRAADKAKLDLPILAPGGAAQDSDAVNLLKDNLGLLGRVTLVVEGQGSKEFQARLKAAVNNRDGRDKAVTGHAYDAVNALLKAYAAAPEPKSGVDIAAQVPKQRFEGGLVGCNQSSCDCYMLHHLRLLSLQTGAVFATQH